MRASMSPLDSDKGQASDGSEESRRLYLRLVRQLSLATRVSTDRQIVHIAHAARRHLHLCETVLGVGHAHLAQTETLAHRQAETDRIGGQLKKCSTSALLLADLLDLVAVTQTVTPHNTHTGHLLRFVSERMDSLCYTLSGHGASTPTGGERERETQRHETQARFVVRRRDLVLYRSLLTAYPSTSIHELLRSMHDILLAVAATTTPTVPGVPPTGHRLERRRLLLAYLVFHLCDTQGDELVLSLPPLDTEPDSHRPDSDDIGTRVASAFCVHLHINLGWLGTAVHRTAYLARGSGVSRAMRTASQATGQARMAAASRGGTSVAQGTLSRGALDRGRSTAGSRQSVRESVVGSESGRLASTSISAQGTLVLHPSEQLLNQRPVAQAVGRAALGASHVGPPPVRGASAQPLSSSLDRLSLNEGAPVTSFGVPVQGVGAMCTNAAVLGADCPLRLVFVEGVPGGCGWQLMPGSLSSIRQRLGVKGEREGSRSSSRGRDSM
ncbi:hypothetical protein KIPB_009821 [Kipferlia bialata]|uniref:Uncharacterized protein n=1 Tax=Kipferlia bialata TaxID=797122 RepID=A0A9K3D5N0_9EUKA|nr:hypothetical protein KIPB_009821 [Kipferlia bialata]|eukprot:g9821.t1